MKSGIAGYPETGQQAQFGRVVALTMPRRQEKQPS
jgi:hypothetical protein